MTALFSLEGNKSIHLYNYSFDLGILSVHHNFSLNVGILKSRSRETWLWTEDDCTVSRWQEAAGPPIRLVARALTSPFTRMA